MHEETVLSNTTNRVQVEVVAPLKVTNVQITQAVNNFNLTNYLGGSSPGTDDPVTLVQGKSTVVLATVTAPGASTTDTTPVVVTGTLPDGTKVTGTLPLGVAAANDGVTNTIALSPSFVAQSAGTVIVTAALSTSPNAQASPLPKTALVSATNGLPIVYIPLEGTCTTAGCVGRLVENSPVTHVAQSNAFIQDTYPVANGQVTSPPLQLTQTVSEVTPSVGALAQQSLFLAQDLLTVLQTRTAINPAARNGVGIVPANPGYFLSRGFSDTTHGFTVAVTSSSPYYASLSNLVNPGASLVEEGWWVVTAHEIAHTFGVPDNKGSTLFDNNQAYDVAGNRIILKSSSSNVFDFMGSPGTTSSSGSPPYFQNLTQAWITAGTFGAIFENLLTAQPDPQVMVLSGILSQAGLVQLGPTAFQSNGTSTPFVKAAGGAVTALDDTGAILAQASFATANQLQFLTDDGSTVSATDIPFLIQLPVGASASTIQIASNGQVLKSFNPASQLLIDAITEIPATSFVDSKHSKKVRDELLAEAQRIESTFKFCQQVPIDRNRCDRDKAECVGKVLDRIEVLRDRVERELNNSTSTTSPLQKTKPQVLTTIDFVLLQAIPNRKVRAKSHAIHIRMVSEEFLKVISITAATQGADGSVEVLKDGRVLYKPESNKRQADNFTVTLTDAEGATVTKTVALIVPEHDDYDEDEKHEIITSIQKIMNSKDRR